MTEQPQTTAPTFWQRFGRFLRALIRLILFALVVALITGAIYLAVPAIYSYTILPVQNNRAVIDHLRRTQTRLQEDLTGQLADQRERITQLETDLAEEREIRSQLESELTRQAETLAAQAEFADRLEAQAEALGALEQQTEALSTTLANVEQTLASPETAVTDLQIQALALQMNQVLLKTRLHLTENNAGQAQDTLGGADPILESLSNLAPPEKQDKLSEIQEQQEVLATAIEERPFVAIQELEILWELMQEFAAG